MFRIKQGIPIKVIEALKELSNESDENIDKYLNLIDNILPELSEEKIDKTIDLIEEDKDKFFNYLSFCINLYINYYHYGKSYNEFIDNVIVYMIDELDTEFEIGDRERAILERIFKMDKSIGIFAKNSYLKQENPNNFLDSLIVSDFRYIFYNDPLIFPKFAHIKHSLRITYQKNEGIKQKVFTLNLEELEVLRACIDRAIEKENTLRKLAKEQKIIILKEKNGYERIQTKIR